MSRRPPGPGLVADVDVDVDVDADDGRGRVVPAWRFIPVSPGSEVGDDLAYGADFGKFEQVRPPVVSEDIMRDG